MDIIYDSVREQIVDPIDESLDNDIGTILYHECIQQLWLKVMSSTWNNSMENVIINLELDE